MIKTHKNHNKNHINMRFIVVFVNKIYFIKSFNDKRYIKMMFFNVFY